MCKHIYNLKKQGPSNVDLNQYPKVKQMVEEIILPSRPSSTDLQEETAQKPQLTDVPMVPVLHPMALEKVKSMFPAFDSDSEVELLPIEMDPISSSLEPYHETQPYYQKDFEQEDGPWCTLHCWCQVQLPQVPTSDSQCCQGWAEGRDHGQG